MGKVVAMPKGAALKRKNPLPLEALFHLRQVPHLEKGRTGLNECPLFHIGKVVAMPKGTALKRKNLLPLVANAFLKRSLPILKKDRIY